MENGRSRKAGTNSVTIIVRTNEKENKKEIKKVIRETIRALKNAMDGEMEFEWLIVPKRNER